MAAWRLDWSRTSLHGSPSRVRLVLNNLNKGFINRIDPPGEANPDTTAMQLLYYGVALSLLEYTVKYSAELSREMFEEGTLGQYLIRFISLHFSTPYGPTSASNIAKRYEDNPEAVKSFLQSRLNLPAIID
jgi:hypothetical protein